MTRAEARKLGPEAIRRRAQREHAIIAARIPRVFHRVLNDFVRGMQLELIERQIPPPPKPETSFAGWTTDEKVAFYARGVVPQRFRT